MKLVAMLGVAVITISCTPEEQSAWLRWHDVDPDAAAEFLYDEGIAQWPEEEEEITEEGTSDVGGVYEPWISLAECESGGDWSINTGNGYYGGLQFSLESWDAVGGSGYPHDASPSEQVHRAELLLDEQGWGAWPSCS